MSLQPSKSDQDFSKNLIANQDVLLSPIEQPNDTSIDFFSFLNNSDTMLNVIEQSCNQSSNQEQNYNNMFEILRSDDPEVVELLETLNGSDFVIDFLPQISLNTAAKVLDESIESVTNRLQTDSDEQQQPNMVQYQTIQLKTEFNEDEVIQTNQLAMSRSTRTSQRLLVKKERRSPRSENNNNNIKKLKRKRSVSDDDDLSLNSSENDFLNNNHHTASKLVKRLDNNSVDFENDEHIYCDDDDDDEDDNDVDQEDDYLSNEDEDDGEKDFKNYVRNYNLVQNQKSKINQSSKHDPNKKESNKEAATRYRLKKLTEKERLFETRMCLENENSDVKRKIESTQTEINYLKSLLVQLLLTKGVLDTKF